MPNIDDVLAYAAAKKAALAANVMPASSGGNGHQVVTGLPEDTNYGLAALADECAELAALGPDTRRNSTLNNAALKLSGLVEGGQLTDATMRLNLESAARACGLPQAEIDLVLRDNANGAIAVGKARPRSPVERRITPVVTAASVDGYAEPVLEAEPAIEGEIVEHTSWWPRPLAEAVAELAPTHLGREDGAALFYAGKINGLIGESESGKTWVALLAVLQALRAGQGVLYLDFEDSAGGIVGRLRALGATETDLGRFTYVDPDEALHIAAQMDLNAVLAEFKPALIVVDGFNAAMTLLGLDLQSNRDATIFAQTLLKPLARTGAAVIYIDHLPKNREAQGKGGIGAQAKRAMTTGCAIRVDVVAEFGRGMTGRLKLTVDKDRAGHVRAVAGDAHYAGSAVLTSSQDGGSVELRIETPDLRPATERPAFRPTHLMEKVSRFLEAGAGPWSTKAIEDSVTGKAEYLRAALAALVDENYVVRISGPRGAVLHSLAREFREEPLTSSRRPDLVPTSSRTRSFDLVPSPPLPSGGDEVSPDSDEVDFRSTSSRLDRAEVSQSEDDDVEPPWWQK